MPISPENKKRYPVNWDRISARIRSVRAKGRCECRGECGHVHTDFIGALPGHNDGDRCRAENGKPHPLTGSKVVLTVAHLDHTPENCSDENLRTMCQRCHLAYDAEHHARTRKANA